MIVVCRLENWAVSNCAGTGTSKQEAKNNAAKKLIDGEQYCVSLVPCPIVYMRTKRSNVDDLTWMSRVELDVDASSV